jgi:hypothetical protein
MHWMYGCWSTLLTQGHGGNKENAHGLDPRLCHHSFTFKNFIAMVVLYKKWQNVWGNLKYKNIIYYIKYKRLNLARVELVAAYPQ